ncbi:HlyC/CorC family transporter [bacterium]|nr:HlyC/CorC family transporter [candidate division CSSED10-310 bacterium]
MTAELGIIIILLFVSAFFSGSESAIFSLQWWHVYRYKQDQRSSFRQLATLLENPGRILVTILFGNTLVNVASSALAERWFEHQFNEYGLFLAIGIMTIVLLIFGEITPKIFAVNNPEAVASSAAPVIRLFLRLFVPVVAILEKIVDLTNRLITGSATAKKHIGKKDFLMLASEGKREGILSPVEHDVVERILGMDDENLSQVMVPRTEMVALPENVSFEKATKAFRQNNLRRIPLFRDDLDHIIGVLYAKDLLPGLYDVKKRREPALVARSPYFVPSSVTLKQLYLELKARRLHLAVVLDEYGGTAGLITLEDLLKTVLKPVTHQEENLDDEIIATPQGSYIVSCRIELERLSDITGIPIETSAFRTLNGLILNALGQIPETGTCIEFPGMRICIRTISTQRIETVELFPVPLKNEENDE